MSHSHFSDFSPRSFERVFSSALLPLLLLILFFAPGEARAAVTTTIQPSGPDVVANGSGTINLGAQGAPAPPVAASATVSIRPSANSVRETDLFSVFVDISNMRDQYGNPITPSSGNVVLNVGGTALTPQTFSSGQLGIFRGSFLNPAGDKVRFQGAVFQSDASGSGYFMGTSPTTGGSVELGKP